MVIPEDTIGIFPALVVFISVPARLVWLLSLFAVSGWAPAAVEISNLADYQVIQRDGDGARLVLRGTVASSGELYLTIRRGGSALPGLSGIRIADVSIGPWKASLPPIPAGGPYLVEISLAAGAATLGRVTARQVLVGDLWVLAGQSNMVGRALLEGVEEPDDQVNVLRGDSSWALAREPLHESRTGPAGPIGAGLGLSFAKDMVRRTGIPIGLIPCAVGGTSLWQWEPGQKLYTNMLARVRAAGGRVQGLLWYQGEADARTDRLTEYGDRFRAFVSQLRADFNDPKLPFYFAQIGRYAAPEAPPRTAHAQGVMREVQRLSEPALPRAAMAATLDLEMQDHVHVNTAGLRRLGARFARLACKDLFPLAPTCRDLQYGPRPAAYHWEAPRRLRVTFTGVNGSLVSGGRVLGFSLHDSMMRTQPLYYRAWIPPSPGNQVILELHPLAEIPQPLHLWYGYGADPPCNLRDMQDMAVPGFGPVELPALKAN